MRTGREATKREQLKMWEKEGMVVWMREQGKAPEPRWKLVLNSIGDPFFSPRGEVVMVVGI